MHGGIEFDLLAAAHEAEERFELLQFALQCGLGAYAGADVYVTLNSAGSPVVASGQYGRDPQTAVANDRWFYGSSDTYEIEVRGADGSLL